MKLVNDSQLFFGDMSSMRSSKLGNLQKSGSRTVQGLRAVTLVAWMCRTELGIIGGWLNLFAGQPHLFLFTQASLRSWRSSRCGVSLSDDPEIDCRLELLTTLLAYVKSTTQGSTITLSSWYGELNHQTLDYDVGTVKDSRIFFEEQAHLIVPEEDGKCF